MAEEKQGEVKENFKYLVRIANTDLDGNKIIMQAMDKIKGVSYMFSNMACYLAKIDPLQKAGLLSDEQVAKLDEFMQNPKKFGAPHWMLNRRKDPESGEDNHLLLGDLKFTKENDIKRLRMIKSYRGTRHASGLPSRGQRTKSNFRKSKSRGKGGLGVKRVKKGKKG